MNPPKPPSGRVTLIFTDIEDSSRMTNALGEVYRENLLPEHNRRVRAAAAAHNGYVVKTGGDSFMVAFEQPTDGVACAAAMQEAVTKPALTATDEAGKTWTIKLRIGVHQALEPLEPRSSPEYRADYLGSDINFAARVESIGAGGQILVSDSTHEAAKFGTPEQWKAWPNRRIKSFDQPETVWELLWDGQSRGEPGSRFLPDWFKGEQNLYIPRPELESAVLAHFGKLRPDGSVPRLLTLHAYGGMGKTRLAVACAIQAVGAFQDGVFFVRLDDNLPTAPAVAEAIGAALGLAREAALPDKVLAALSDKDLLLLLDNYESVDSDPVQSFLIELLKSTSAVRLLVTGRDAVKLSDVEQEVSLDEGMTEAEADALFLARARLKHQQGQQWQPDQGEKAAIHRIIRLSERIPIAIELAAAWVKYSTVKEIADGIEATALGTESKEPPRSLPIGQSPRHGSLTRSLNYSYERLEPEAQEGLARLGLFAGSFASDSVAGACRVPQAKELLFRLQDASLIHRVESNGRSRFTMLRPTRAYAAEKLGALPEASSLRQQFVRYYRNAAKQRDSLTGPSVATSAKVAALDWFEEEWPNLLAAAKSASGLGDWKTVSDISDTVFEFWKVRGHWAEVEELYNWALEASRESKDRHAEGNALNSLGIVYKEQGRWAEAENAHQQSLAICREFKDRHGEGVTLNNLGNVYEAQGRWAEAEKAYQQSLAIKREFKDRHGEGGILNNLGNVYQAQGRWAEAEQAYQQSLAIKREFKDRHGEGQTLGNLGNVYQAQGRWGEAEQAYQQSLAICREFKDRYGEGQTLNNLGLVYQAQGRWGEAEQAYQQSRAIYREFKDRHGEGVTLNNLALLKERQEDIPAALEFVREAIAVLETTEAQAELQKARDILKWLEGLS
jgi:tetratricopeptide (TPR) repeat protein/class 3 adenylate cyclase